MATTWEFKLALQTDEELGHDVPASDETLPDGQPKVKILYAITETEEEAIQKVEAYVAITQYRDIKDKTIVP